MKKFNLFKGRSPIKVRSRRRTCFDWVALEDRCLLSGLSIAAENQLPGTPQSEWDISGVGDPTIQGFATDISVNQGSPISFKIDNTTTAPYHIDIYRMGYYGGMGARKVASIPSTQTLRQVQPNPLTDPSTGLIDCGNWAVSATWNVPADATSGIYFADVIRDDTGGASQIIFIVRDDSSHSDILFQTSDSTWEAYNKWGGNSLYQGTAPSSDGRAYKVSYNRPLSIRGVAGGLGTYNDVFHSEYPMVRWLESNGYDVTYFTDVDAARYGSLIQNHQVYMPVGHDEYWSGEQRDNVEAARDAGVNLAFMSGNQGFWKTRWETSIDASGTPYRTLVCYKETKTETGTAQRLDPTGIWTGSWRDATFSPPADGGRPENALSGSAFMVNRGPVDLGSPMTVPAADGRMRFWRNTSIANQQALQSTTFGDFIIGYEWDADLDNGFRPAGLFHLSTTTLNVPQLLQDNGNTYAPGTATHNLTLYRANSGALVFSSGTVQWMWGLDGNHDDGPSTPVLAMQQATVNLLADMYAQPITLQPGLVPAFASTDITPPTSIIVSPGNAAAVQAGTTITIAGTASDTGGGVVGGVEISLDGGQTWHPVNGRENWTYTWIPSTSGPVTIRTRAVDDSGNLETPSAGITISSTYLPTNTANLVAAYSFNEGSGSTLIDSSGKGNNGTISGAIWTQGIFGSALSFNGFNSSVTVNSSSTLNLSAGMTLEAWVRPTQTSTGSAAISKEITDGQVYALYTQSGPNHLVDGVIRTATGGTTETLSPTSLPLNTWSHVALTYDGSVASIYINGLLVASQSIAGGNIVTSTGALRIGGNSIYGDYFQGLIDEIRIYNRALNVGEINSDMNTPVGGSLESTPPSVSWMGPANGSSVAGLTTLAVSAQDNLIVRGVQFLLNGAPLGPEVATTPYSTYAKSWDTRTLPNGTYVLAARVRDAAGNITTTTNVMLTVANPADTTAPTIRLTGPLANSTVKQLTIVSAAASDNLGVVGVQFLLDGVPLGAEDTTAPYRILWDTTTASEGPHTLVAVARDAAGNLTTSAPFTVTVDNAPPTVIDKTPEPLSTAVPTATNLTAVFNESVNPSTISFVLRDSANNIVPAVLSYNDATRTATLTTGLALHPSTTYTVTLSGAKDLVGNQMASTVTWSFTTDSVLTGATIWGQAATPAVTSTDDANAIEVGLKFQSDVDGFLTGVKFYKGAGNTGTHVGHLWAADGTLLATATFTDESATGWQQASFPSPIAITAHTTYVISYYAPNGHYASSEGYFTTSGVNTSPLHALADGEDGSNGLFLYGVSAFPTNSYAATNYWVDVVFSTDVHDTTAPTITGRSPTPNATGVATTSVVSATLSEPIQSGTATFTVTGPNGALPGTVAYDAGTRTITFNPSSDLSLSTTYTVSLSGVQDLAGNAMATASWSFTTASSPTTITDATIWASNATPAVASASDNAPYELGVKFRSTMNGYITGIRFYKGPGNTGTHVGHLWAADGTLLATATFIGESTTGWQTVSFSSPVPITANTTYVASYAAPAGGYAQDRNYFTTNGVTNGPLQALASGVDGLNGVFSTTLNTFPTNSWSDSNYWVDVLFSTTASDTTSPTVIGQSPAANATGVAISSVLTATFSEAVQSGTVSFVLSGPGGQSVAATLSYNPVTHAVTLTPAAALAPSTTYTATVSGAKDLAGNTLTSPVTWSFTTNGDWIQTTANDFGTGTNEGTTVTNTAGGEVQLSPELFDDFVGSALGSSWTSFPWDSAGGGPARVTVSGGILSIAGAQILSAPGSINTAVEGLVSFAATPYEHFGIATDLGSLSGDCWAIFSTMGTTDTLFARVNLFGTVQDVNLGALPSGFHRYRVQPTASGFDFYVDNTLRTSLAGTFPTGTMPRIAMSTFNGAPSPALQVDWARWTDGTFTSSVFDAGRVAIWDSATWTATVPSEATLVVETSSGNTATPDGSWSAWTAVDNGGQIASPAARYLRYRVRISSTDPAKTAVFSDMAIAWH